jgi:hypothetical protein
MATSNATGIEYPSEDAPNLTTLRGAPYGLGFIDLSTLEFHFACDGALYVLQMISSDRVRLTTIKDGESITTEPHKHDFQEPDYPDVVVWAAKGLFGIPARFRAKVRKVNI